MAAPMEDGGFDSWLSQKLLKINPDTDVDVFVSYIKGILEDEDEELKEAITEILSQVVVQIFVRYFLNMLSSFKEWPNNILNLYSFFPLYNIACLISLQIIFGSLYPLVVFIV